MKACRICMFYWSTHTHIITSSTISQLFTFLVEGEELPAVCFTSSVTWVSQHRTETLNKKNEGHYFPQLSHMHKKKYIYSYEESKTGVLQWSILSISSVSVIFCTDKRCILVVSLPCKHWMTLITDELFDCIILVVSVKLKCVCWKWIVSIWSWDDWY